MVKGGRHTPACCGNTLDIKKTAETGTPHAEGCLAGPGAPPSTRRRSCVVLLHSWRIAQQPRRRRHSVLLTPLPPGCPPCLNGARVGYTQSHLGCGGQCRALLMQELASARGAAPLRPIASAQGPGPQSGEWIVYGAELSDPRHVIGLISSHADHAIERPHVGDVSFSQMLKELGALQSVLEASRTGSEIL